MLASGIYGAVAVLTALYERTQTGKGCWIDVSGQECVAFALEDAVAEWSINAHVRRRLGDGAREAGTGVYPCKDGYISMVAGRLGTAKAFVALTQWVAASEVPGAASLLEPQWQDFKFRQSRGRDRALCRDLRRVLPDARQAGALSRRSGPPDRDCAGEHHRRRPAGRAACGELRISSRSSNASRAGRSPFPGRPIGSAARPRARAAPAPKLGEHNRELAAERELRPRRRRGRSLRERDAACGSESAGFLLDRRRRVRHPHPGRSGRRGDQGRIADPSRQSAALAARTSRARSRSKAPAISLRATPARRASRSTCRIRGRGRSR